jgi:hypothetical protein
MYKNRKLMQNVLIKQTAVKKKLKRYGNSQKSTLALLKVQSHELSDPRNFSANNTLGSPDSRDEAVSNTDSYLRRYLITKIDSKICHTAWS